MDFEGITVQIVSGDRDWVGALCIVNDVQSNGDCKLTSGLAFFYDNVKNIRTDPDAERNTYDYIIIKNIA